MCLFFGVVFPLFEARYRIFFPYSVDGLFRVWRERFVVTRVAAGSSWLDEAQTTT